MTQTKRILLLLVLLAAAFFRLWKLEYLPPGLYPDEAINGNDAFFALKTGNFSLFYPENNGRESLFIWLISLSFAVFGVSIWSMRIVPAVIGTATVMGLYLLSKEIFYQATADEEKSENIAILAAFFLSVSFWHINFSRIIFRAIMFPCLMVFSFYFLMKSLRQSVVEGKDNRNIMCGAAKAGILFGLGFYTYTSFRIITAFLLLVILMWFLMARSKKREKEWLKISLLSVLSILLVTTPLISYFIQNPSHFMGRASQVLIFSRQNPIKDFFKSLILHLAMFNLHGDGNWRHNIAGSPQLFWPVGILFLTGFLMILFKTFKSLRQKDWLRLSAYIFIFAWFLMGLSPGILTHEGVPHALRTIGAIPAAYIFTAWAGFAFFQWLWKNTSNKKILKTSIALFFVMISLVQFNKYFVLWGQSPETQNAFSRDYVIIGSYLNSLPDSIEKFVIVNRSGVPVPWPNGVPMPAQTVMFMENAGHGTVRSQYLLPSRLKDIEVKEGKTVIVPLGYNKEILEQLKNIFPNGKVIIKNNMLIYNL